MHVSIDRLIQSSMHAYTQVSRHPGYDYPLMHFMNVRSPCLTYVMAGGWGGENNNCIKTRPHQTPPQWRLWPYLTLNLINNSYLLLPLITHKNVSNQSLLLTECYKSPYRMRGYPRSDCAAPSHGGPFSIAKSIIFAPGWYKTMHFPYKTYTWATWHPMGAIPVVQILR